MSEQFCYQGFHCVGIMARGPFAVSAEMKLASLLCIAVLMVAVSALPTETGVPSTSSCEDSSGNDTTSVLSVNASRSYEPYVVKTFKCDKKKQCGYLRFDCPGQDSNCDQVVASCVSDMHAASRFQAIFDIGDVKLRYENTELYVMHARGEASPTNHSLMGLRKLHQLDSNATRFTLKRGPRCQNPCGTCNDFRLQQPEEGRPIPVNVEAVRKFKCFSFHRMPV